MSLERDQRSRARSTFLITALDCMEADCDLEDNATTSTLWAGSRPGRTTKARYLTVASLPLECNPPASEAWVMKTRDP
jgi:hypothetical protein